MIAPRRRRALALLAALLLAPALPVPACATDRPGTADPGTAFVAVALGVDDGDSFAVRRADGSKLRIRLAGIDAPERSQPWSAAARKRLHALLVGNEVRIQPLKIDRWQRLVALVEVGERDASLEMLEAGLAWHFARYDSDLPRSLQARYAQAASQAQERRTGLWEADAPEPPWDFRRRNRR